VSATPTSSAENPRRPAYQPALDYAVVVILLLIAFAVLVPWTGSRPDPKRQKTYAELNNLAKMCWLYHQEYHQWPVFASISPGPNYILHLNSSPRFVEIMSANFTAHPDWARYNPHDTPFASFAPDELSDDGTRVVDAYGNDDIILIMDVHNTGVIAPFTVTLTSAGGKTLTAHQTVPLHSAVVTLSPGRGQSDSDVITTYDPTP
jgi:hypothetical protein